MPKKAQPNIPMPADVQEDDEFRPIAVSLGGEVLEVVSIDDRDEAEWWEPEPVFTMHCQVTLEDGRQLVIYRNHKTSGWYQAA